MGILSVISDGLILIYLLTYSINTILPKRSIVLYEEVVVCYSFSTMLVICW